ncbi:MAG: hypothetical protein ACFFDT_35905 [Candidatus Hodarchaeota archaeon]
MSRKEVFIRIGDRLGVTRTIHGFRQFRNVTRFLTRDLGDKHPVVEKAMRKMAQHEADHFNGAPPGKRSVMYLIQTNRGLGLIPKADLSDRETAEMALCVEKPGRADIGVAFRRDPRYTRQELGRRGISIPEDVQFDPDNW